MSKFVAFLCIACVFWFISIISDEPSSNVAKFCMLIFLSFLVMRHNLVEKAAYSPVAAWDF